MGLGREWKLSADLTALSAVTKKGDESVVWV